MAPNPLALIAEVTHRCPLHCVYCSNPLQLVAKQAELSADEWVRVFQEASRLGVLHLHLTGGEPAARTDLEELIAGARQAGLYTNLITSGLGIPETRLPKLVDAGLDHIQLSFQDSKDGPAQWIAGAKGHAYKIVLAEKIRQLPLAFTVNLVVHRQNLDHIEEMIEFIEQLRPDRVEVAQRAVLRMGFEKPRAPASYARATGSIACAPWKPHRRVSPERRASIAWCPTTTRAIPRPAWVAGEGVLC